MRSRLSAKKVRVEILRPEIDLPPDIRAIVERLVEKRLAEILARREDFIFEPFFRRRKLADEIRRLQSVAEQKKGARFFEENGCLRCTTRDRRHGGLGFCVKCYSWVKNEFERVVSERQGRER